MREVLIRDLPPHPHAPIKRTIRTLGTVFDEPGEGVDFSKVSSNSVFGARFDSGALLYGLSRLDARSNKGLYLVIDPKQDYSFESGDEKHPRYIPARFQACPVELKNMGHLAIGVAPLPRQDMLSEIIMTTPDDMYTYPQNDLPVSPEKNSLFEEIDTLVQQKTPLVTARALASCLFSGHFEKLIPSNESH